MFFGMIHCIRHIFFSDDKDVFSQFSSITNLNNDKNYNEYIFAYYIFICSQFWKVKQIQYIKHMLIKHCDITWNQYNLILTVSLFLTKSLPSLSIIQQYTATTHHLERLQFFLEEEEPAVLICWKWRNQKCTLAQVTHLLLNRVCTLYIIKVQCRDLLERKPVFLE